MRAPLTHDGTGWAARCLVLRSQAELIATGRGGRLPQDEAQVSVALPADGDLDHPSADAVARDTGQTVGTHVSASAAFSIILWGGRS